MGESFTDTLALTSEGFATLSTRGGYMEPKLIAVRLEPEQLQKLDKIVKMTGWNQSEVIRQLIDNAVIKPPAVLTHSNAKKDDPLAVLAI